MSVLVLPVGAVEVVETREPKIGDLQDSQLRVLCVLAIVLEPQDVLGLDISVPTDHVVFRNMERVSWERGLEFVVVDHLQALGDPETLLGHPQSEMIGAVRLWQLTPKIPEVPICPREYKMVISPVPECREKFDQMGI